MKVFVICKGGKAETIAGKMGIGITPDYECPVGLNLYNPGPSPKSPSADKWVMLAGQGGADSVLKLARLGKGGLTFVAMVYDDEGDPAGRDYRSADPGCLVVAVGRRSASAACNLHWIPCVPVMRDGSIRSFERENVSKVCGLLAQISK